MESIVLIRVGPAALVWVAEGAIPCPVVKAVVARGVILAEDRWKSVSSPSRSKVFESSILLACSANAFYSTFKPFTSQFASIEFLAYSFYFLRNALIACWFEFG